MQRQFEPCMAQRLQQPQICLDWQLEHLQLEHLQLEHMQLEQMLLQFLEHLQLEQLLLQFLQCWHLVLCPMQSMQRNSLMSSVSFGSVSQRRDDD